MNWTMANRLGHIAATKAHSRLGVDVAAYPVNVSKAIDDAGVTLMRRPLPRLFGVYIEANGNRGVMVNSIMTRATRRHTAAHELGHHEFDHRPDPARQCSIEVPAAAAAPAAGGRVRAQGQVEMSAEAFAAWFLMPRRAVMAAMSAMGVDRISSPADAYQLSMLLGTTHRATCRHLVNVRMATPDDSDDWARVPPGRLKRALAAETGLTLASTFDMDVWDLRTTIDARVEASVGDLLVLPAVLIDAAEDAGLVVAASTSSTVTVECVATVRLTSLAGPTQTMSLVVHDRPLGLYLPAADPSLGEVELMS